ncbi:MAG TPA: COX15/CtaA family protein [bacterium]|nr:COX15/CtaA family protein [bacterium]
MTDPRPLFHPRLHRFALFTAGCTFLLLLAGALVTSTGSSLAVPDWPLSFGTLFPQMTGGVLFEHGHRLVAGTVATLTAVLAVTVQRTEGRPWVRKLAWAALGVVVLQALLGGLTVLLKLPTQVSVAHAGLAQVFFCLIVTLALVTSRYWIEEKGDRLTDRPSPIRQWALWTTVLIYAQIVVGAVTRHSGAGLAILDFPLSFGHLLPPEWTGPVTLQFSHTRIGAFLVLLFTAHTAYRACYHFPDEKGIFLPAATAGILVWIQCFLGLLILATSKAILPTSLHVIVGGATLASMLVLTLNSYRLFRKS